MNKILGRLIFFLYPDNKCMQLIKNIFMNEFVIYPINNPDKLYKLLKEFPSSIIFINIDYNNEFNWKDFIQKILEDKILFEISINIICMNKKIEVHSQNIDNIFDLGKKKDITDLIINYLDNNYAKGRRKYIRVELEKENRIKFNLKINDKVEKGFITNINSSAGVFSFSNKSLHLDLGTIITKIEFKIAGIKYSLSGTIFRAIESFDENLYVIIFDIEKMKTRDITGIKNYIYKIMQKAMEKKLETI